MNARDTVDTTSDSLKARARELGFDACGIASARVPIDPSSRLRAWLDKGYHADMDWIARTVGVREDVREKLPGARSVVVVARNYYSEEPAARGLTGRVARYAWGRDYHRVLKKPLNDLARYLDSLADDARSYASIDTGPVLERAWAQRAGVAAIGKNSLGLRRDMGSWFFLATILTTIDLTPDPPAPDLCGTCKLCIDACPTDAIVAPRIVDSNRCIAYHTIENRHEIPEALHAAHDDWVFGCDICQDACPWNRFAEPTDEPAFHPSPDQAHPSIEALLAMDQETFNTTFAGTPIRRAKWSGMRRNAAIAKRNADRRAAVATRDSED